MEAAKYEFSPTLEAVPLPPSEKERKESMAFESVSALYEEKCAGLQKILRDDPSFVSSSLR